MKKTGWIALAGISLFSAAFYIVTGSLMRRWLAPRRRAVSHEPLEPVTFFRPLKSGEAGVARNLQIFLSSLEAGDQVIIATTAGEDLPLCEPLSLAHPELDLTWLQVSEGTRRNPKINKLVRMEPFAKHEKWIILDSDAIADRRFLEAFRREWQSAKADAISAPYAFRSANGLASRLDALGTGIALWPGVALLKSTGHLNFLTGACMGIHAPLLRSCGGWRILGEALADDHELGRLISRAGGKIEASDALLSLEPPDLSWKQWILHQHRAFVTFRTCNPAGSLGIPLTHGVGISFFCALLNPRSLPIWLLHTILLLLRAKSAKSLPGGTESLRDLWIVSLLEPLFWLVAWLPLPVRWGRRWIRV